MFNSCQVKVWLLIFTRTTHSNSKKKKMSAHSANVKVQLLNAYIYINEKKI